LFIDSEGNFKLPGFAKVGIVAVVSLIVLSILYGSFTERVSAGQACTITEFGKPVDEAGPGFHFKVPVQQKFNCLNSRKQVYETVTDPKTSDSKANYIDYGVDFLTFEGIQFTQYYTVQYHVPVENARKVWESNARTDEAVKEQIVKFHTRAIVPQVLNTYTAEALYLGELQPISQQLFDQLSPLFAQSGVVLDYFNLKRGVPDAKYQAAVDEKAAKREQIKQKEQEQQLAAAEAERVRIEANGVAAKTVIEANANAEKVKIDAQAAADAEVIDSAGNATAITNRGTALAANPQVLEWERIQAIRSANVIYLPSDSGVIPILPLEPQP